jgi:hypothetical protein
MSATRLVQCHDLSSTTELKEKRCIAPTGAAKSLWAINEEAAEAPLDIQTLHA